jgi:hypothetical protein
VALLAAGCGRPAPQSPPGTATGTESPSAFWVTADPAEIDLGFVAPGAPVAGTMSLHNPGHEPATIKTVVHRAPLLPVDADGLVVPARGRLDLPIELTASHAMGERRGACVVSFANSPRTLTVTARVIVARPVHSTPAHIILDETQGQKTLVLASVDGRPFRVLEVAPDVLEILDGRPLDPPRRRWRLHVDIDRLREGQREYAIVATDHPECGVLEIPIRGRASARPGRVRTLEGRLNLGTIRPGVHAFGLTVTGLLDGEVVEAIESDTARFTARLNGAVPDARSGATVRCTGSIIVPEALPGLFEAALVVLTSGGETRVPVLGRIDDVPPG